MGESVATRKIVINEEAEDDKVRMTKVRIYQEMVGVLECGVLIDGAVHRLTPHRYQMARTDDVGDRNDGGTPVVLVR